MAVVASFKLRQVTSVLAGPLYRAIQSITEATNVDDAVFVYKTETQAFDHVATSADMETFPDTRDAALAAGLEFYRQASVTRDWASTTLLDADVTITLERVQLLASEVTAKYANLGIDRTTTITGA